MLTKMVIAAGLVFALMSAATSSLSTAATQQTCAADNDACMNTCQTRFQEQSWMCAAMSLWNPWAAIVCETGNINQAANCSSQCDKVYFTCIESLPPLGGGGGGGGWPGPGGADNNGECSPPAGEVCPAQCSSCGGIW